MTAQRLLIGYDGSDDARNAIAGAADALSAGPTFIVTVWDAVQPGEAVLPIGSVPPPADESVISEVEGKALLTAKEGAELASQAGLEPEFDIRDGSGVAGIADALIAAAKAWDADVIVVGRRAMSRIREVMLGSVSDAVLRHSPLPVFVVPAPPGT